MGSWTAPCSCCLAFARAAWPHVVPPLAAIALEAPQSLKTWLAVQDTPPANISDDDDAFRWQDALPHSDTSRSRARIWNLLRTAEKVALTHVAPAYLLAASLFGAYLQAALPSFFTSSATRVYHAVALGPLFTYAAWRCFAIFSGIYALGIRRDGDGDPYVVFVPRASRHPMLAAFPALGALGIAYGSIICDSTLCTVVVHVALLQTLVSADTTATKTFRGMVLYALTNIATLLVLALILFFPLSRVHVAPSSLPALLGSLVIPNAETRYPLFALAVLWNIFPTELAALCFRADFARYASQRVTNAAAPSPIEEEDLYEDKVGPIYLPGQDNLSAYSAFSGGALSLSMGPPPRETTTPAPTTTSIPCRLPFFFTPRPLFLITLTAHVLTTLALLALAFFSARSAVPQFSLEIAGVAALAHIGPLLPLASVPIAVLAVLVFAAIVKGGGDAKRLWRYTEVWSTTPGTPVCACRGCRDSEQVLVASVKRGGFCGSAFSNLTT